MATQIDFGKLRALYRADLPEPVDVLNLIHLRHWPSYRRYAVSVTPLLKLSGAGPQWMGKLEREIHGPKQADKLMVVRYPSHRAFLRMVANPYYLLINRFRERGVQRFEASFTHSPEAGAKLRRHKRFLVVHYNATAHVAARERVREILENRGATFVYSARETSAIDITAGAPRSTDPNPLTFKQVAFFAIDRDAAAEGIADAETLKRLGETTEDFALHVYAAEDPRNYVRVFGGE